jgi:hypothetical protein
MHIQSLFRDMKKILAIVLLIVPIFTIAQSMIKSSVVDSKTNLPLVFCTIQNENTQKGVISNSDSDFLIEVNSLEDTLSISFLGYETIRVQAFEIQNSNRILLKEKQFQLQEIVISSNNDYIFDILEKCKTSLKKNKLEQNSKAFFTLNTSSEQKPLEFLECYYNATQEGGSLNDLYLKNGRLAIQPLDTHFFLNLNTTQIFNKITFTKKNELLPSIILQFRKKEMKKNFVVNLKYDNPDYYHISFKPMENSTDLFNGEIWIDKESYAIKKISLHSQNITRHPFVPIHQDSSTTISNISVNIEYSFLKKENNILIDHIVLNLAMDYYRKSTQMNNKPSQLRTINIESILYFYDFGKPFLLPYFQYSNQLSDYRKLSIIPYNQIFWDNRKLLLTKKQKEQVGLIGNDGFFLNYDPQNYGNGFVRKTLKKYNYEFKERHDFWSWRYYYFWEKNERIILKKDVIEKQTAQAPNYKTITPSDLYEFSIQILLDINPLDSSFACKSFTIFDLGKTFYHLKTTEYSNTFINIYFDICEIERRKMEEKLKRNNKSISEIETIYHSTLSDIENITNQYKKEVQRGNNIKMLRKWNNYVLENLGINNIEIFKM